MAAENICPDCGTFMTSSEIAVGCCQSCEKLARRDDTEQTTASVSISSPRKRQFPVKAVVVAVIIGWVGIALAIQGLKKSPADKLQAEYAPQVDSIRELVNSLPETNAPTVKPETRLEVMPTTANTRFASADAILNATEEDDWVQDDWGVQLAQQYDRQQYSFDLDRMKSELDNLLNIRYLAVVRFVKWKRPAVENMKFIPGGGTVRVDLLDIEQKRVVASFTTVADQSQERLISFGGNSIGYVSAKDAVKYNLQSLLEREIRSGLNATVGSRLEKK